MVCLRAWTLMGLLLATPAVANEFWCLVEHPQSDVVFYGEGRKAAPAQKALQQCQEWAVAGGYEPNECWVALCEPRVLGEGD